MCTCLYGWMLNLPIIYYKLFFFVPPRYLLIDQFDIFIKIMHNVYYTNFLLRKIKFVILRPKYHGYTILGGILPNMLFFSLLTMNSSSFNAHDSWNKINVHYTMGVKCFMFNVLPFQFCNDWHDKLFFAIVVYFVFNVFSCQLCNNGHNQMLFANGNIKFLGTYTRCRATIFKECPHYHGHKGNPRATPNTCSTIGERALVILV